MTNERRYLVGVHIEGIPGSSDTDKSAGRVYYYDTGASPHSSSDYDWEVGLTSIPSGVSTSINPLTGEWQLSSFTFRLSNSTPIATYLLHTAKTGATYLANALDDSNTLVITTGATPPDGTIVFCEDETIILDGDLGGGLFASCTRGAYGSTASAHAAGALLATHPTFWVPRLVTLITHDTVTGTETVRWRGYLDRIETSETGANIELRCVEAYARWKSARLNTEPNDLNAGLELVQRGQGIFGNVSADNVTTLSGSGWIGVQTRSALLFAQKTSSGRVLFGGGQVGNERLGTTLELEKIDAGETRQTWREPVWEVLVWDRLGDAATSIGAEISPLTGGDAFHPVRIARELLSNTELPDVWSLGLAHIDLSSFDDAVTDEPGLQIDQLVLGANGQDFSPFEVAESLLRFAGYIPSITSDGAYTIKRFRTVSIQDVQTTSDDGGLSPYSDGPLRWQAPFSNGVTEISVTTGAILDLPGFKGVVLASDASTRSKLIRERERVEYTFPFLRAARGQDVSEQLASSAALVHYELPRLRVRVADLLETGIDYDLGAYVALEDLGTLETAWWVDRTGTRIESVDLAGRTDVIGMVVERDLDLLSMTYTLTLLFMAYRTGAVARERAPSAIVASWSSPTITVTDTFTSDDPSYFTVGDEVELWSRAGVKLSSSAAVVSAISGDDISVSGSFGVTPAAGNILQISDSDTFFNDTRYSVTGRPYVHFADANGEIDHNSGTEQADEYGGGTGVIG